MSAGTSIHAAVGQMIARLEIEALTAMLEHVAAINCRARTVCTTRCAPCQASVRMARVN